MATNLFHNPTKAIPMNKADSFIVRTPMTQNEIGGRTDHIPKESRPNDVSVSHVPNET